ncbi:uncharacterized protein C8R40DRAFT_1074777 [Lentinula edodes]|uniref:uncharacterized protein n=1 Tax=Lentinula edodes TaxID=5353 RepID=UPI001E8CD0C5|nr:uncharacterized protein C8R40DRAFT_1074777 [Lentinula edodes]KAH7868492.1 hypothetical protein C8R40DRAFT_1074777 [Lentinula edodes]
MTIPAESSVPAKSTFDQVLLNGATGVELSEIQESTHHDHADPDTLGSTSKDTASSLSDLEEHYSEPSINHFPGRFPADDFGLTPGNVHRFYHDWKNNVCDTTNMINGLSAYQELRLPPVSPSLNVNNFATTSTVYPRPSVASDWILPYLNRTVLGGTILRLEQYRHGTFGSSISPITGISLSTGNTIYGEQYNESRITGKQEKTEEEETNTQSSDVNLPAESSVSTESTFNQVLLNGATGVELSEIQESTHHDHADPDTLGSTSKDTASSLSDLEEHYSEPSINHFPGRFPADDFGLTSGNVHRFYYDWKNNVCDTTNMINGLSAYQELRLPPVSPSLNVNNFATTSTVYPESSVASDLVLPNLNV